MSDAPTSSVLRRMLRPARTAPSTGLTGARMWSAALPRVSEARMGLVLSVDGYETGIAGLEDLLSGWNETALSLSLAGPGGARGLFVLSEEVLTAAVEIQILGRVTNRPCASRAPTDVDAALAGHMVDAWLGAVFRLRTQSDAQIWSQNRRVADARGGKLALEDGVYDIETVHLSLGDGARSGSVKLILPAGAAEADEAGGSSAPGASPVLAVEAQIEAVLSRIPVPLSWFQDAAPGALIPIDPSDLARVSLETSDGDLVMHGRLGWVGGRKAIRLGDTSAPESRAQGWELPTAAPAPPDDAPRMAPPGEGRPDKDGPSPEPATMDTLPDLPDLPEIADVPELSG